MLKKFRHYPTFCSGVYRLALFINMYLSVKLKVRYNIKISNIVFKEGTILCRLMYFLTVKHTYVEIGQEYFKLYPILKADFILINEYKDFCLQNLYRNSKNLVI